MSETPRLEIEALDAWYGAARILFGVSLHVGRGEAVALIGRNGAGKSTTMKAVMGLVTRRAARLDVEGRDLRALPTYEIARHGVGYVPEDRRIFTELTVAENLDIGRRPRPAGTAPDLPDWTPQALFALFPNLAEMQDRPGGAMSGGEQQMLAIARTLVGQPRLLLLDEPSEGVAPVIVDQMIHALHTLKRAGLSMLIAEQNLDLCRSLCDRAYVIEQGELRWHGAMAELEEEALFGRVAPTNGIM
ncbi:ABC transporter ATP-binding protein [Ancylobacter sp. A5.8]|uniref:ABC transporter ATP-binding protein n=1 Tax=Ancylobacter gelatini TaxID=2919920 RepID=UPI001F4DE2C7|nr:ABC transporter ATP-binding protein [Ancylobacter gelatini]MCJ8144583.1 ABC transporter ATP-binding protein [Ancylobacter gelatini]